MATVTSAHIGIPERYVPALRAAQLATCEGGRYQSMRYLIATRILERLRALGYGEDLVVDSLFSPAYRWAQHPMMPLHSRATGRTGGTHTVIIPGEVVALVERYREDYGLPGRSRAAVQLLSLDESDDERGRWDLARLTARIPAALAVHVEAWQSASAVDGKTVAVSCLILAQLCAAMEDLGIAYDLPRGYHIRWRRSPSDVMQLVTDGKLQASVPRILRPSLARAREELMARGHVGAEDAFGRTVVRLLWLRVGRELPASLREASPGVPKTIVKRSRSAERDGGPDVYSERFIVLCRERAARDRWLARGGVGRPPPSTVDDHLGRRVAGPDAYRIAADRGLTSTDGARTKREGRRSGGTAAYMTW